MIHCLHGAVGSPTSWELFQDSFPEPLNALDLWTLFDRATPSLAEAGQLIAARARPNDILLGYSMGGRLALHALLAEPAKWRAAIIISTHPGLTDGHRERIQKDEEWSILSLLKWQPFLRKWNQQAILSGSLKGFHPATFKDREAVSKSFQHWSLGKQEELRPQFARVTCPVLWLTGENDPKFTHLGGESSALIPGARHQILPGCGHRLPWEKPDLFLNAVEKFLAIDRKTTILNP